MDRARGIRSQRSWTVRSQHSWRRPAQFATFLYERSWQQTCSQARLGMGPNPASHYLDTAALLKALVESSDDAIISKDLHGTIISWNPAAERMFGYPAPEAIGQSIRIIIPPDRQDEATAVLDRIARGETI